MWRTAEMSEAQRVSLLNLGEVEAVDQGEFLFTEGENARSVYCVLNGLLVDGEESTGFKFRKGDWILEANPKTSLRTSSVQAIEQSRVLVISDAAFENLKPDVQNHILNRINRSSMHRLSELKKSSNNEEVKRSKLTAYIVGKLRDQRQDYEKSELIVNILQSIPRLPLHVTELIQLLLNEKMSAKQAAEVAKRDPSLVSEILKTVNSARYGLQREVSDLNYAIMYLGFNEVYQITISCGLRKTMPDSEQFRALHVHSLVLSHVAHEICQLCDRLEANTASTIAILHELGKSVLFLLAKQNPKSAVLVNLLDPAKIGAMLLRSWNIPEIICQTVELQPIPLVAPPSVVGSKYRTQTAVLYVAHAVHDFIAGQLVSEQEHPFLADYMSYLNLKQDLDEIVKDSILKNFKTKGHLLSREVKEFFAQRFGPIEGLQLESGLAASSGQPGRTR